MRLTQAIRARDQSVWSQLYPRADHHAGLRRSSALRSRSISGSVFLGRFEPRAARTTILPSYYDYLRGLTFATNARADDPDAIEHTTCDDARPRVRAGRSAGSRTSPSRLTATSLARGGSRVRDARGGPSAPTQSRRATTRLATDWIREWDWRPGDGIPACSSRSTVGWAHTALGHRVSQSWRQRGTGIHVGARSRPQMRSPTPFAQAFQARDFRLRSTTPSRPSRWPEFWIGYMMRGRRRAIGQPCWRTPPRRGPLLIAHCKRALSATFLPGLVFGKCSRSATTLDCVRRQRYVRRTRFVVHSGAAT